MDVRIGLVLLLALAAIASGQACSSYARCSECITQTSTCGWCQTAGIAGCIDISSQPTACPNVADFLNPNSVILTSSTNSTLITPTFVSAFTRFNRPLTIPVTIRPGPIPLDILFVEDLSGSMSDDVVTLRALAPSIITNVRMQLQNNTNFGITGFIEKSDYPAGVMDNCARFSPASSYQCWNYDAASWLSLTANGTAFQNALNTLPNNGNVDWPEAATEGVMKGALCSGSGWRAGARRMMLISTDADTHVAGDGRLLGALEPRQFKCSYDELNELFLAGIAYDYPSLSLIRAVLLQSNIVPILAITANAAPYYDNLALYQKIVNFWGFGFVYQLTSNSDNIVAAIITSYNTVAQTITIITSNDPLGWISAIVPAAGYTGAVLGTPYAFQLTVTANVPGVSTSIQLASFGFGDIIVNATSIYTCVCAGPCPMSGGSPCAGNGVCECGKCFCNSVNYTGVDCSCDLNKPCNPPCLNGNCVCGSCACFPDWTGQTCNCSSLPCPGGGNCNGNGNCVCGVCQCTPPYYGADCFCRNGTCPKDHLGNDCSNHGTCNCGACNCNAGWSGTYCNCSTTPCPGLCSGNGVCVCGQCQCNAGWTGPSCQCRTDPCPRNPVTNVTCSGNACVCGQCVCSLATGPSCNCSSFPCQTNNASLICSGHGNCVCGQCQCDTGFTGANCACDTSATCPADPLNPLVICSGHGSCLCGNCVCAAGWTQRPNSTVNDCSCQVASCPTTPNGVCDGHGSCVCGQCVCQPPWTGPACACDSSFVCLNNCSGHGTCDVCGTKTCTCFTNQQAAPPPPVQSGREGAIIRDVGDNTGYTGADCSCSTGGCGVYGDCGQSAGRGSCVCGTCECVNGYLPPDCTCNPSLCTSATCVHGTCNSCGGCECDPGYSGVDCSVCAACVTSCTSRDCGTCTADATCGWCQAGGNCSLLSNTAGCPNAFTRSCAKPAAALYNSTEFRAGAYALGGLLILFLILIIIYKIWIWRRDKYLWEQYNSEKDWGVAQSPLYQDAFAEASNPLYDPTATNTDAPQGGAPAPAFF
eukprot:c20093_g1_i2.p1 GENE.c20093_g1_i2~~c20093_g1_i2.p1  ORF type:complete len:1039 (+),score=170.40 c20093_g1_i2:34-3150(+)